MIFFPQQLEFSARKNHLFFRSEGVSDGRELMIEGLCCTVEAKVSLFLLYHVRMTLLMCFITRTVSQNCTCNIY